MNHQAHEHVVAAAIQLEANVGDVAGNLRRAEALCLEAIHKGARLVGLPEFFTSPVVLDRRVHDAVLPIHNDALDMMRRLSRAHCCWIGGSMLVADGDDVYNRYSFVEPDGRVHQHDKDLPTMVEGAFYAPGKDDGLFDTELGGVGAAVCWELIRNQTLHRLAGQVDIVMTGTHWWTVPDNWGSLTSRVFAALGQYNRYLSENAPAELARLLGAPVLQASHCGRLRSHFMLLPGIDTAIPSDTRFVGATQIVDARGRTLSSRLTSEGPGVVLAKVELGARHPIATPKHAYWLPKLPATLRFFWHQQNLAAKSYYRRKGRELGLAAAKHARGTQFEADPDDDGKPVPRTARVR